MPTFVVTFLDWNRLDRDSRWDLSDRDPAVRERIVRYALTEERFRYRDQVSVEADDLDAVFSALQDPGSNFANRSLSVGDVIADEKGKTWIVAPVGFEPLEPK